MPSFTYKPAPLARPITITIENGQMSRDGHWSFPLSEVRQLRRASTTVRYHNIDDTYFYLDGDTCHRLGVSYGRKGAMSDSAKTYHTMIRAVAERLDPETPVVAGQKQWVRVLMSVLGFTCLAFAGVILALEGVDDDTLAPLAMMALFGSGLLYVYWPFRAQPSYPVHKMIPKRSDKPWGVPKNEADETGNQPRAD